MTLFRTRASIWLLSALMVSFRLVAEQATPTVQDLSCKCAPWREGKLVTTLTWRNPPQLFFFFLSIRRDGEKIALIAGNPKDDTQLFFDSEVTPGSRTYEVTVVDFHGDRSDPVACTTSCEPDAGARPVADILGPNRLVLPSGGIAEAVFDARGSRDSRGGRGLAFEWFTSDKEAVEILSPGAFFTRVRFKKEGQLVLGLRVRDAADPALEAEMKLEVQVVGQGKEDLVELFPPPKDLLVAVAGKPLDIPVMVVHGQPFPKLELANAPEGFVVDPVLGKIIWVPPIQAAGQGLQVELRAFNDAGGQVIRLDIAVVDSAEPFMIYAFPLPPGGRDDPRGGAGAGDEAGGGASLGPAPPFIVDQSSIEPTMSLELKPLGAAETCSVQLVTAGGAPADPFDGLLFAPGCGGAGSAGLYFSVSAATKVLDSISNDFTIELWLSSVSAAVPPGGRGYVFSMSSGTTGVNWLLAHDGGQTYTAVVRVNGASEELSATVAPRPDGLTHLVFVRQGDQHRLYANGARASSRNVPHVDVVDASWDASYQVYLGNSGDEARPFDGRLHFAAIYGQTLTDGLIAFLDDLGPKYPISGDDVPPPIADICPDPREIRRGIDADGSLSRSGLGGGGGGDGRGGAITGCTEALRPFEWTVTPSIPASLRMTPVAGEAECLRRIRVDYDPLPPGTRLEVAVTLKVTQMPIRGITKTDTDVKMISLPTYFLRGDANQDEAFDISDGITMLVQLFLSGEPLLCADAGDSNDDGKIDTSDAVHMFHALFTSGPAPPAPFTTCGYDPTDDTGPDLDLGCDLPPVYCR